MKIKRCPYCGGRGYMEILHDRQLGKIVCFIKCEVCGASGMRIPATHNSSEFVRAIACWNMRTSKKTKYIICM